MFLISKTNHCWSNHGIVCLIISVLGSTQMQNILHEKKSGWIGLKTFRGDFKNGIKKLNHLVKTIASCPTWNGWAIQLYCFSGKCMTCLELEATYILKIKSERVLVGTVHYGSIMPKRWKDWILFVKVGRVMDPVTVGSGRVGASGASLDGRRLAVGGQVGENWTLSAPCWCCWWLGCRWFFFW